MKKLVKITSILGATVLGLTTAGVGVANAADTDTPNTNASTTATVGLEDDENAAIELISAPTLGFGSQLIGSDPLDLQATDVDAPLKVSNPGKTTGWNVTVSGTPFKDAEKTLTLSGAQLSLNGVVSSEDSANESTDPTTGLVNINDQAQPIFSAAAGAGIGNWLNTFKTGDDSAKLNIPAGNVAGNYVSDLTWTLTAAPQ